MWRTSVRIAASTVLDYHQTIIYMRSHIYCFLCLCMIGMPHEFASIYHAFNMTYVQIKEIAPHLVDMGFTHIQFPPIQRARVLSGTDLPLLQNQIKARELHLQEFESLYLKAMAKQTAYPNHTFTYLLRQRANYINQPTLRRVYKNILNGVCTYKTKLEHLFDDDSMSVMASIVLAVECSKSPKKHPFYPLYREAELIYNAPHKPNQDPQLQTKIAQIQLEHARTQHSNLNELLVQSKQLKKQYVQLKSQEALQNKYDKTLDELRTLSNTTAILRNQLHLCETPTNVVCDARIFNLICICEMLLYPPWWLIYQPVLMEIGDTFLGRLQDINDTVQSCKQHGLSIIADVVVNNLAAVAGERDVWIPYTQNRHARTLADSQEKGVAVAELQNMLYDALGTDDLSTVTPPFECKDGQEPTHCWMSGALPQLNQNHPAVIAQQRMFLHSLIDAGIDGVRIDASAHITPHVCKRVVDAFDGLSYIEYVGGSESWRQYPDYTYNDLRIEDFAIGEDLYTDIFSEQAQFDRIKNYGHNRLRRHTNLDSVVMIVNHDQIMGSIPSRIFDSLPSRATYELSLAYLLQRIYGIVLLMPHDIEFIGVHDAIALRKRMRAADIVREYMQMREHGHIFIYKFNSADECKFVCVFNLTESVLQTTYGAVPPLSFRWWDTNDGNAINLVYNEKRDGWMRKYYRGYNGCRRGVTRRQVRSKQLH